MPSCGFSYQNWADLGDSKNWADLGDSIPASGVVRHTTTIGLIELCFSQVNEVSVVSGKCSNEGIHCLFYVSIFKVDVKIVVMEAYCF